MDAVPRQLRTYRAPGDREPFWDWFNALKDPAVQARIIARLDRLEEGNLGDHRVLGNGVTELKLAFGPGFRIYFGSDGPRLVLLLIGGDKKSQRRDIKTAQRYWNAYQTGGRHHEA